MLLTGRTYPLLGEGRTYDLAVSSDWEYDGDFIDLLRLAALSRNLTFLLVTPPDLPPVLRSLERGLADVRVLVDRAAVSSPEFLPLQERVRILGGEVLEPVEKLRWASDKATMHLEFIADGLETPYTLILPSFESRPHTDLREQDLDLLGRPFVIKPANTTGGCLGVVESAFSVFDVDRARKVYPADKYLLQKKVIPAVAAGKRFWFRGFYVLGIALCTWWDDRTHLYAELTPAEVAAFGLEPLFGIVHHIAKVCKLRFFSTEIVRDASGRFLVIDYVNETCDMRLQSKHKDGVPDGVCRAIAERIGSFAEVRTRPAPAREPGPVPPARGDRKEAAA